MPAAARGPVTGLAKLGGLVLLVFGLGWALIGGLMVAGGSLLRSAADQAAIPGLGDAVGGVLAGFGIVILVIALLEALVGIGVMLSKEWGRILGILYSLVFGAASLIIVTGGSRAASDASNGSSSSGGAGALVIGIVLLIGYIYALVVLAVRWRRRAA